MDLGELREQFRAGSYMEQAREIVKRLILSGAYRPGQRVKEAELAQALGISRSPVREAVMNLANEGLITLHPQRGAFVREFGLKEVRELFEVREAVEVHAVRLAAQRAGEHELSKLKEFLQATERTLQENEADPNSSLTSMYPYPVDLDFHREIAVLARNERLTHYVVEINIQLRLARVKSTVSRPERAREAYDEHVQIYEAFKRRDPDEAERAMKSSLRNGLRNVEEISGELGFGVA